MASQQNQLVPRRKTFWKMIKTVFIPAQAIAKLMVGCGGGKGNKVKRRLTMRNMQEAKETFIRASLQGAINRSSTSQIHTINRLQDQNDGQSVSTSNDDNNIVDTHHVENGIQWQNDITNSTSDVRQESYEIYHDQATPSASQLPAPLNIEEAQCFLESLTLIGQPDEDLQTNNENSPSDLRSERPRQESNESAVPNNEALESDNNNDDQNGYNNSIIDLEAHNENENCYNDNDCNWSVNQRERPTSFYVPESNIIGPSNQVQNLRRSETTAILSNSPEVGNDFSGWRKSSVEVSANPPVTLAYIPSGLCVGDRIVWLKDDQPEIGTVRWIGKIRMQFYAGIEFDKPVGNSSGIYGYGFGMYKRLFTCQLPYGRFVPVKELVLYKDYHDSGVKSGIVCIICRDDFLDAWEPSMFQNTSGVDSEDDLQPFNMVSTKCGHLYHWGCLDNWFNTKKKNEFHCPLCSRSMTRTEVIRIFPSQL